MLSETMAVLSKPSQSRFNNNTDYSCLRSSRVIASCDEYSALDFNAQVGGSSVDIVVSFCGDRADFFKCIVASAGFHNISKAIAESATYTAECAQSSD